MDEKNDKINGENIGSWGQESYSEVLYRKLLEVQRERDHAKASEQINEEASWYQRKLYDNIQVMKKANVISSPPLRLDAHEPYDEFSLQDNASHAEKSEENVSRKELPAFDSGRLIKLPVDQDDTSNVFSGESPQTKNMSSLEEEIEKEFSVDRHNDTNTGQTQTNKTLYPTIEPEFGHEKDFDKADGFEDVYSIDNVIDKSEKRISNPYRKGDDINHDYFEFLRCDYIDDKKVSPVLEEDPNFFLLLRAIASKNSSFVEGKARTGKSLLVERLKMLLPDHEEISGASNNAMLDMADTINAKRYVIFTEYQSVVNGNPKIKEAVKCISENKDYSYRASGKEKVLKGDVTIIGTCADENVYTQKRDVEVSGRFVILKTDSSKEKIDKINEYQDGLFDGSIKSKRFSKEDLQRLTDHMGSVLDQDINCENPFAKGYSPYLPPTQKSIHYRTLYHSLIEGCARFDSVNRVAKETEEGSKLLLNIEDVYLIHEYYHETYCKTLKRLTGQSYYSLEKDPNKIRVEENREEFEYEVDLIDSIMKKKVDWQDVWDKACKHMQEHNPGYLDEWVDMQTKDGHVVVYDPVKQVDVYLCKRDMNNEQIEIGLEPSGNGIDGGIGTDGLP